MSTTMTARSLPPLAPATVARMGNRVASVDARVFHTDGAEPVATGKAVYSIRRTREP